MNMAVWWLILQAVAITLVGSKGTLFDPIRAKGPAIWREFSECPLCVGVWVGAGLHAYATRAAGWTVERGLETLGIGSVTGVVALLLWRYVEVAGNFSDAQELLVDEKLAEKAAKQTPAPAPPKA